MRDTAIQRILILHDPGVLCKLHSLDCELDHFSCPPYGHTQGGITPMADSVMCMPVTVNFAT